MTCHKLHARPLAALPCPVAVCVDFKNKVLSDEDVCQRAQFESVVLQKAAMIA